MRQKFAILLCVLLCCLTAQAQSQKVTGQVLSSDDNQPVVGASVVVKGSNAGTITDIDGHFSLDIPQGTKTLQVSYIGMKTQYVELKGHTALHITLSPDVKVLDQVMVVAYGTTTKGAFTGAASVVNADKIALRPVTNATSALLGSTPGVIVSAATGSPGDAPSIYIRGLGSINASSNPFIVLNGMPYDGSISSINPDDIASMTVLKDASSTALYGSRAGNGVLMITTKCGDKGTMKVNVKFSEGFVSRQSDDYQKVNAPQYLQMYWENLRNQNMYGGSKMPAAQAGAQASSELFNGFGLLYNPYDVPANEVIAADGSFNSNARFRWADDTNWYDAMTQIGKRTNIGVNLSGGGEKSNYYASVSYLNEDGYMLKSNFQRYTANLNVSSQVNKFLKVGVNSSANLSYSKGNPNTNTGSLSNPFRFARSVGPIYPIHRHNPTTGELILDADGNPQYDFGKDGIVIDGVKYKGRPYLSDENPVIEVPLRFNQYRRNTINAKAFAEITFLKDFKFTVNASVGANSYLSESATTVFVEEKDNQDIATSTKTNTFTTTWDYNQLLSYAKDIAGGHRVDVLVGHESYDYSYKYLSASVLGQSIPNGNYGFDNYTSTNLKPDGYEQKYRVESYLSRLNYNYKERYYLSGSFRRDGSSRFNHPWGNFWSVGASWKIDREEFMKPFTWIDMLKLRTAYGEVGNDQLGTDEKDYYTADDTYLPVANAGNPGYIQSSLGNKELRWEVSKNFDAALEFSFLRGMLSGTVEFFNRQSDNLLWEIDIPPSSGFSKVYRNAGSMYNRGVEVELNTRPIQRNGWTWTLGINATTLKNRITYLAMEPKMDGNYHRLEEGHSRYEFYLYQWRGVDPASGNSIYLPAEEQYGEGDESAVEVNGQWYTTSRDKALQDWSGVPTPKVSGGINTSLSWKGLTLSLTFNYQLGGKLYDSAYASLMTPGTGSDLYSTFSADILRRWQKPGDITDVPLMWSGADNITTNNNAGYSTRWLVSSNLFELANANLSYDVPKPFLRRFQLSGLRLYASANNLFQLTARRGLYPRRSLFSGNPGSADVYLPSKVISFGLDFTF
ncbi:MAG: TonB-dependent receptor [Mediterranea sp.]|jgi:TonB-linked SusC/RagA family outer membrane protein|nr:TonB-dependent receptor [Mediterranea sp.]